MQGLRLMSIKQKQANLDKLEQWQKGKKSEDFLPFINLKTQSFNKQEVAKSAGFSYNALKPKNGNPDLISALESLEDRLRSEGLLAKQSKPKGNATVAYDPHERSSTLNAKRVAQLEKENIDLQNEIKQLGYVLFNCW